MYVSFFSYIRIKACRDDRPFLIDLKTDFCSLTRNVDRHDVVGCDHAPALLVLRLLLNTSRGVLHVDALKLVGHESGVAPCLWVANLICLVEHTAILLPSLIGKTILEVSDASLSYL